MLGIVNQHEERRTSGPGADAGISNRERRSWIPSPESNGTVLKWTQKTLCAQDYASLRRSGKGLVKRYVEKVTGRSRAQVTRLIDQYVKSGIRQTRRGRGRRFTAHYTAADIALLAEVDEAHETLSGPATRKILYRGYYEFADARFQGWQGFRCRTSTTSASGGISRAPDAFTRTRPTPVSVGERRRPGSGGRPGYIRVDPVHQGDQGERRAFITSTQWMKSRSGKWSVRSSAYPKLGWSRCGRAC
jgi:hypothetical protein